MAAIVRDFLYACRTIRRAPVFAMTVIGTLGLGIGATTTVFSVIDTLVFQRLPYPESDRLVVVGSTYDQNEPPRAVSPMNFFDWRERNDVFDHLIASRIESKTLLRNGLPQSVLGAGVSAGFFEILGAVPIEGRTIEARDDRAGQEPVVVLGFSIWQSHFGGDRGVVGGRILLTGVPHTIVGVMPAAFHAPEVLGHRDVAVWFPLSHLRDDLTQRDNRILRVLGRLTANVSVDMARESMTGLQRRIYDQLPMTDDPTAQRRATQLVSVASMRLSTVDQDSHATWIFLASGLFLLAIAWVNVANLLLTRSLSRSREFAVRVALGAGQRTLARQVLTETVTLSVAAGGSALLLAHAGVGAFRLMAPADTPRLTELTVDMRAYIFALVLSIVVGVCLGVLLSTQRCRTPYLGGTSSEIHDYRGNRLRSGLVSLQLAVTLVLLVGAGLLINSFARIVSADPGFDPVNVARMELYVGDRYQSGGQQVAFFDDVLAKLRAVPGVRSAAATDNLPMTGNTSTYDISILGYAAGETTSISVHRVTPGFFETLRMRVIEGRDFEANDRLGNQFVAVLNEAAAKQLWRGADALGKVVQFGPLEADGPRFTVVGVVHTVHQLGLGKQDGPALYLSHAQSPFSFGNVVVRTAGAGRFILPQLRAVLHQTDDRLAADDIGMLSDQVAVTVVQPRFIASLLGAFAVLALAIATCGVFGTMSYLIEQRRRELGVRMALGARGRDVVHLVMKQGLVTVAVGVAVGGVFAAAFAQVLRDLLYGIPATDVWTFATVSLVLIGSSAIACWIPARSAATTPPMRSLTGR